MRRGSRPLWLIVAIVAGGCAAEHRATSKSSPAAPGIGHAQASHEYRSSQPSPERTSSGASSPASAVTAFARSYVNWTSQSVTADLQRLALNSVGQARAAMALAAAQASRDYELQRDGIANTGKVIAVAPVSGRSSTYVVVTRERTTATNTTAYEGLRPEWHVALAGVVQGGQGRWAVSSWQPES